MAKYKVIVNRSQCIACGVAPSTCPQVFELGDDNGKNRIVDTYSVKTTEEESIGEVPEDLYDCVSRAAQLCPVSAITVEKLE